MQGFRDYCEWEKEHDPVEPNIFLNVHRSEVVWPVWMGSRYLLDSLHDDLALFIIGGFLGLVSRFAC